jgi:2',3'-cyclic-nucleotide 2'-phosphodiesterase (5'-nucleotidase family)
MSNDRNGKYAQIAYLPFNRKTGEIIRDKIVFEGPLPICERLFKNKLICDLAVETDEHEKVFGNLVNFKFHNEIIEKEPNITQVGQIYRQLFDLYDKDLLTVTNVHLESTKEKENALGNLYCDFLRHISGADIAVVNAGSFRIPLYRGNITNATIWSFDPFGNDLVKFEAFGYEVKKIFKILQKGGKGYYPTSGVRTIVKSKPSKKVISTKLFDGYIEKDIEDNKTYTIASSDFCFPLETDLIGGDDFKDVYKFFRPRNGKYISVGKYNNSRDIFIEYLRNIDYLQKEKYLNPNNPRLIIFE